MGASATVAGIPKSTAIKQEFLVTDAAGADVTGLLDAAFTKTLIANQAVSAVAVTITEISALQAPGIYYANFTPNATGIWSLRVKHATYGNWNSSWYVNTSSLTDLDFLQVTALPTTGLASGTMFDILRAIEAFDGKGRRLTWTYDGSNRVSSVALVLSYDGFVTNNKSYTIVYTYGDASNPLRPTVIQWS